MIAELTETNAEVFKPRVNSSESNLILIYEYLASLNTMLN